MKLSRKKAIELCIELWTWLAKTGLEKWEWPEWENYEDDIEADCWFCEFNTRQATRYNKSESKTDDAIDDCKYCPLLLTDTGSCRPQNENLFKKWSKAMNARTRKKYAKLFLAQIKAIPIRKPA